MKIRSRCCQAVTLLPVLLLSGCLFTTRRLPIPRPPTVTQSVTPGELVKRLNDRWAAIESLNATVDIQASTMKTKEGVAKDYTSFRGIILMRKPEMLRVLGRLPVIGTPMFDMASDGKTFTLKVPSKSTAFKGSNRLRRRSANAIENMRPGFFFDAMVVRGLEPGDEFMVTADSETVEDAARKHFFLVQEYILSIMRRKAGTQELQPVRVIHFHRDDLLPYQQDLYDDEGNLETEVLYARYADFGDNHYPSTVVIKRPLEEYQIVMTVEKVSENLPLTDDQFQIKIPDGTEIKNLE